MPRLLRVHFASIGHADARLAPLTLDFTARDGSGTGADTVLWLRNGGGKSTILNLFYSLFRPDRREFLGASAEGRARHIEDYVKAEDLAFVVTEWDVDPVSEEALFARPPARRRIVGQVLSWKDRQRSKDVTQLRRRFFSLVADSALRLEDLPIDGLRADPVRSLDAFRAWFDDLHQKRPDLEPFWDDAPRKWGEHLERIGLDPELFWYQLQMNAREGSADEAFRFRTTDEFIRFYLKMAFDAQIADQVSSNLERFRDKLARRPELERELAFLIEVRALLSPLLDAVAELDATMTRLHRARAGAAGVEGAVASREAFQRDRARSAEIEAEQAERAEKAARNDSDRLSRWANGLDRLALELDLAEARTAFEIATAALGSAEEEVRVGDAAVARDEAHRVVAARDAKAAALAVAQAEQAPLRRAVARAGATLSGRLTEAATTEAERAAARSARSEEAKTRRVTVEHERRVAAERRAGADARIGEIDRWLAEREGERERLRAAGVVELREEMADAHRRWEAAAVALLADRARHEGARDGARASAEEAARESATVAVDLARLAAEILTERARLDEARRERECIEAIPVVREIEGSDAPDPDAPGIVERLSTEAEKAHRQQLAAAVDGAEDERAWGALERTGRLPPTADVERALAVLESARVAAWSAGRWLSENAREADPTPLVQGDPALWHGIVVPDEPSLRNAAALLAPIGTRLPVVIGLPRREQPAPDPGRVVLSGHPAHWDERAGARLRDELGGRRGGRERERERVVERERSLRGAADRVERWLASWGGGRLLLVESDLTQKVATRGRTAAAATEAAERRNLAMQAEKAADALRGAADQEARLAAGRAERAAAFVDRYDAVVEVRRAEKGREIARRASLTTEMDIATAALTQLEAEFLEERDAASAHARTRAALLDEQGGIDLSDPDPPDAAGLVEARALWTELRAQWGKVVSEDRLQWELDRLQTEVETTTSHARRLANGRETAVDAVPVGTGRVFREGAGARGETALRTHARAEAHVNEVSRQLSGDRRRREAADLPSDEVQPTSAEDARRRAAERREQSTDATAAAVAQRERANAAGSRQTAATTEAERCAMWRQRLGDVLPDAGPAEPATLPEAPAAVGDLVDACIRDVRSASDAVASARDAATAAAEAVRDAASSAAHEAHRSRVKERLKSPPADLARAAPALHADVEERLEVVRAAIEEIDQDRRFVLNQLEQVAMDGVKLLQAAERASRLPAGLGVWEGEPFLRVRVVVPVGQAERQTRLEPLVARLVAKGTIPGGRDLVDAAVRELAGQQIEATLLKPDAHLRRDRLPVTDMQTFSRGQQLTVAILLYCTLARLRAQQRGRASRPDAGVLLLDNPVGTCSSVALLELQRTVARQMRVQLVYTTGVNDPDAVATFPNTVRLRNQLRARATGDLHVTLEPGVEAVRIVAIS